MPLNKFKCLDANKTLPNALINKKIETYYPLLNFINYSTYMFLNPFLVLPWKLFKQKYVYVGRKKKPCIYSVK